MKEEWFVVVHDSSGVTEHVFATRDEAAQVATYVTRRVWHTREAPTADEVCAQFSLKAAAKHAAKHRCSKSLAEMVREFRGPSRAKNPESSGYVQPDVLRFRLRLIAEEFVELLEAASWADAATPRYLDAIRATLRVFLEQQQVTACDYGRAAIAHEAADLAYVVEGLFQDLGIDSRPVLEEVHAANMRKFGACSTCGGEGWCWAAVGDQKCACKECDGRGKRAEFAEGKVKKPEGWVAPDIEGVLRAQGWEPD